VVRPRQTCPRCGEDIELLTYCGNCGKPLAADRSSAEAPPPPTTSGAETAAQAVTAVSGTGSAPAPRGFAAFLGPRGQRLRSRRPSVGTIRFAIVAAAALLAVIALLADEPGLALVVAAVAAPLLIVDALIRRDVFDRLPPLSLLAVAGTGVAAGAAAGAAGVAVVDQLWLDEENLPLYVASLGLGARSAKGDGSPPVLVLAVAGLLLPAVGLALSLALPLILRRWATFRNEVMDGVTLGAAAGGGFAIGTAIANLWPLLTGETLGGSVPEWTVAAIGVTLLRPFILVGTTALVGAGIWRYDLTGRSGDLLIPLAAGLGWAMAYAFVSLFSGGRSPTLGLLWSLAVAVAVAAIARSTVASAVGHDRRWLTAGHVVCPNCRSVTPAGKFCSVCRSPLPEAAMPVPASP
jgi:hypothetical protein